MQLRVANAKKSLIKPIVEFFDILFAARNIEQVALFENIVGADYFRDLAAVFDGDDVKPEAGTKVYVNNGSSDRLIGHEYF